MIRRFTAVEDRTSPSTSQSPSLPASLFFILLFFSPPSSLPFRFAPSLILTMGSISLRDSIRWLPEPASEPTSTLVITSPKRNFVDIRVLRPEGSASNWPTAEGE